MGATSGPRSAAAAGALASPVETRPSNASSPASPTPARAPTCSSASKVGTPERTRSGSFVVPPQDDTHTMPDALSGIRIIDFGTITAGANATQMLADLGADVIKIESASRPDTFRAWQSNAPSTPAGSPGDDPWNRAHTFNMVNRNKRGICLDLKQPRGRELVLELAKVSDGVAENYRHGVMDRLGAGYADLSAANPAIVMISIGSQGSSGPE